MACRICKGQAYIGKDGRCRSCRAAKTATDMRLSYGVLQSIVWQRLGEQMDDSPDPMQVCPVCRRLFLPNTTNQKYDSNACAVKAAQAAYRKRKRTQAQGAPVGKRKEPSCSSSDASTAAHCTPKPSTLAGADTTATLSGKEKSD